VDGRWRACCCRLFRKGAKYYPLLQRGTVKEKLKDYFTRHTYITNSEYRRLMGVPNVVTASYQLARLAEDGFLRKEGKGRGTRYFLIELTFKS